MIYAIEIINHVEDHLVMPITDPSIWPKRITDKIGVFDDGGYIVKNISGITPGKAIVNIPSYASIDGGVYASSRKDIRNITLSLVFDRSRSIETLRQNSYYWFPLRREITLISYTDNRTLKIQGYVESNEISVFSKDEGAEISILCPDPMFIATDYEVTQSFDRSTDLFAVPVDANTTDSSTVYHPGPVMIQSGYYDEYDVYNPDIIDLAAKSYTKPNNKPSRVITFNINNGSGKKSFAELNIGTTYYLLARYYISSRPAPQYMESGFFSFSSSGNNIGLITIREPESTEDTFATYAVVNTQDYNKVRIEIFDTVQSQVRYDPYDAGKPLLLSSFYISGGKAVPEHYSIVYDNGSSDKRFYHKEGSLPAMVMSTREVDPAMHFLYEGDTETGVTMTIIVVEGSPTGILNIYNVYAEQLMQIDLDKIGKITGSPFTVGDQISVNTIPGHKNIRLIRSGAAVNILNALVRGSDWITMFRGDNYIRYITQSGYDFLNFNFSYQPRFEGV